MSQHITAHWMQRCSTRDRAGTRTGQLLADGCDRPGPSHTGISRNAGLPASPEKSYSVQLSYSSQLFGVEHGALHQKVAVVNEPLKPAAGAGLLAYENDTAILTLIGLGGHRPPTALPSILDAAASILPADLSAALRTAHPIGDAVAQHYPMSTWRRYDKLRRFPDGLLVIGDAVCSLNPVWGQGMTSAALQASTFRTCLSGDVKDLRRDYFRGSARKLAPIWRSNRLLDFTVSPANDWRRGPKQFANHCTDKVWSAAESDISLTETFVRTIELLDPLAAWLRPATLSRIARAHL